MSTIVLNIKGISKQYNKFILGPIDLQVEQGTVVALVGANSSGKSTLLRVIMNLIQAEQGNITLFGQRFREQERENKQKIGYIGDHYSIFGHLTIRELADLISYWYPTWDQQRYVPK